jgi:hypothetical protein
MQVSVSKCKEKLLSPFLSTVLWKREGKNLRAFGTLELDGSQ